MATLEQHLAAPRRAHVRADHLAARLDATEPLVAPPEQEDTPTVESVLARLRPLLAESRRREATSRALEPLATPPQLEDEQPLGQLAAAIES